MIHIWLDESDKHGMYYINAKIREIYPDFNIGISTPIKEESDRWFQIYRHWSFKPKHHIRNLTRTKRAKK